MTRPRRRKLPPLLLALLCTVVIGVSACGGESDQGLLSSSSAESLRASLDEVEQAVDDGKCTEAASQATTLKSRADSLGPGVDADLRRALSLSAGQLQELVTQQCEPTPAPAPEEQVPPKPQPKKKEEKKQEEQKPKEMQKKQEEDQQDQNQGTGSETGGTTP